MKDSHGSMMFLVFVLAVAGFLVPSAAHAHCQIPCGIYDDHARVHAMLEDAVTVEKSIRLINELADKKDPQSRNQLVRWVMNKEAHAQKIIETISDYFLTQRVKPGQKDYAERLAKHHAVVLAAMKSKQSVDRSAGEKLSLAIASLGKYYPKKE